MNHISIQLRPDGFSFCVYRPSDRKIVAYRNYETLAGRVPDVTDAAAWEEAGKVYAAVIQEDEWLSRTYAACDVFSDFPLSTLVPAGFADNASADLYFQPCAPGLADRMAFHSEALRSGEASVFFGVPASWETLWQPLSMPAVRWHHLAAALADRMQTPDAGLCMMIALSAGHAVVMLRDSVRGMLHHQTYEITSLTDVLYYALGVLQMHGAAPADCSVRCVSSTSLYTAGEACDVLRPYAACADALEAPVQEPPFENLSQTPLMILTCA